jgi:hypothetical protein
MTHGNFTPLKDLKSDTRVTTANVEQRFKGTAQMVQRARPCKYLLKITDTKSGKVVLEKYITANPDGGMDTAIMKAHDLARTFEPKVFRSKNFKK